MSKCQFVCIHSIFLSKTAMYIKQMVFLAAWCPARTAMWYKVGFSLPPFFFFFFGDVTCGVFFRGTGDLGGQTTVSQKGLFFIGLKISAIFISSGMAKLGIGLVSD